MKIEEFINELSKFKSNELVNNMYFGDSEKAKNCRKRLKEYLENINNPEFILVGEAPGYKGCARTGVTFTSDDGEMSAKIMTETFKKELPNVTPLMWNAFPFHPHKKGDINTNRKPTVKELEIGQKYFKDFLKLFPSVKYFFAVGRTSEKLLRETVDSKMVVYIRHPAHGGKKQCQLGIEYAVKRFCVISDWDSLLKNIAKDTKNPNESYKYLKEHEKEFRDWYFDSDHDEYPWAYLEK